MQTKTAAGLIGANAYLQETRVPMKVFKEARAEGDTAKMERAMGYVEKLGKTALEYKKQADKGLKEDAEKARKEEREQKEKIEQRTKEKRAEAEQRLDEVLEPEASEGQNSPEVTSDEIAPILTYTRDGGVIEQNTEVEFNVLA